MRTLEEQQYKLVNGSGIITYEHENESVIEVTNGCQLNIKFDNKPLMSINAAGDIVYHQDNIDLAFKTSGFVLPTLQSTPITGGTRYMTIHS